jgi:hypothetical protein
MKQPIAGVVPSDVAETTVMTIWPSIAMYPSGQWLGKLYSIRWPDIYIFRLGNLFALLSIPLALVLYFCRVAPKIGTRYRLTNRRVIVERGISGVEERAIQLREFDDVKIDQLPGQAWYVAADLSLCRDQLEVFRLQGVSRPEALQRVIEKAHQAHCLVASVREQQQAEEGSTVAT